MQDLLNATLPGNHLVVAEQVENRYVVKPAGAEIRGKGIPLLHGDEVVAYLGISVSCTVDTVGRYLAVEKSVFTLFWSGDKNPLLRLDYDRNMHTAPCAHWQVHAERGAFSAVLGRTGTKAPHSIASLHLPVGGSRMRPGLEDFLEFLIRDCGIDAEVDWLEAICAGRVRWRSRQVGALVRDAPEEAIRVLAELGYEVTLQAGGTPAPTNLKSLRRP